MSGVLDRRRLMGAGAGAGAMLLAFRILGPSKAQAIPATLQSAMDQILQGAIPLAGALTLEIPALVENGNSVPVTLSMASPMSLADHVTAFHIFNEKNPEPRVADIYLGAHSGLARVSLRIKLAASQRLTALARTNDGRFWIAHADVIVTLAACIEDLN
jgi:sulfur-oxidizing protein SoxY